MATSSTPPGGEGTVTTEWPVAGLSRVMRHITGHNEEGKSVFMSSDCGDHHRVIGDKQAIGNIIYSTNSTPIELTNDADLKHAKEHEPGMTVQNGTVARMIDFGPGAASPLHRSVSVDYAVVIEGVFKFLLDSGEERIMRPGDTAINRAGAHQWVNITGNGLLPGRILFVLIDVKDVVVGGKKMEGFLGTIAKDYEGR